MSFGSSLPDVEKIQSVQRVMVPCLNRLTFAKNE